MTGNEKNLVKLIAKLSPWLAPLPSGYFIARASIAYLELPAVMGATVGIIIEFLGIASVHTWLWLEDWNLNKRKSDPTAPSGLAAVLGVVYLCATIGLTVLLEVAPGLSTYAPVLFPALAVVGAINLALIAQQEQREKSVIFERKARQVKYEESRNGKVNGSVQQNIQNALALSKMNGLEAANHARKQSRSDQLRLLEEIVNLEPEFTVAELARRIGRSRTTTYKYLKALSEAGKINWQL